MDMHHFRCEGRCTMNQYEIENVIQSAIHGWLRLDVDLDYGSTAAAMSKITRETSFSDLSKEYKPLDKNKLLASVFTSMIQKRLDIPDRFKKIYVDQLADAGIFVGNVINKNIPNYPSTTVDAAYLEDAVNSELEYAVVKGIDFTPDVDTEIANAKTIGELAAMIAKP
ncbi:hypothetical protein Psyr_0307 [Pseudomonas syringae pv. syringae B728a]|uniref:Uncharacterized protein n=2 Tax=Pseudomonas syringae TaxID=317 RepID=Q4ZZP2_PSEU2|nr:hypothetical protein Psyr_0307 [Pseudomonas syringae pv. syringae B728a]PYD16222.1 hypothetical protein DND47_12755 [Pseudomonas syringae pv. syringae]